MQNTWLSILVTWLVLAGATSDDDEYTANNAQYRCGIQKRFGEQLIHHGWTSELGQWPWHVALYQMDRSGQRVYKCGGTLIDQRHVLTSAHCVVRSNGKPMNPERLNVELGKHLLFDYPEQVQIRNVSQIHIHPEFSLNRNDIAVLVLDRNVRYSEFVIPICLERSGVGSTENLVGKRGWVAGWGLTENNSISLQLKTAQMPVVNDTECVQNDPILFGRFISAGVYCASDRNGTSVCLGDSGGGMYFSTGDFFELRGIVSFAAKPPSGGCDVNKFIIFTNVAYYYPWIVSLTRDEIQRYELLPKRISEQKCQEYAKLARKRKNGVCYNSRSPHAVAIANQEKVVCTGVLVSDNFVMTSDFGCVEEKDNYKTMTIRIGQDLDLQVRNVYRHPGFADFKNIDIVLIELEQRVNLEQQLIPACLATPATENLYDNLLRTGFSGIRSLQIFESSENQLMSFSDCMNITTRVLSIPKSTDSKYHLCVELKENFEETGHWFPSQGLPGSPLQTVNSRSCMSTVIGIATRQQFGTKNWIVYTRVSTALDWIEDVVWRNGTATRPSMKNFIFRMYFMGGNDTSPESVQVNLLNGTSGPLTVKVNNTPFTDYSTNVIKVQSNRDKGMKIVALISVVWWLALVSCSDDDEFTANNALYRCGIQKRFGEQLIHHGWSAELGQWPWHVALYHLDKSGNPVYKCGGTLIDQRHILTAAHCVVRRNGQKMGATEIRVEFGKHDLYDFPDQVQTRNVSEVHVHPEFGPNRNDIALLVVDRIVRFSEFVVPICMEDARRNLKGDLVGVRGWVAGWGVTESGNISTQLKTAQMPVVSNTECVQNDPTLFGRFISPGVYCASDKNSTSVCLGDSGGGMYFSTGDHYELRGIVSFAGKSKEGSCDTNKYVIFTNVAFHYPWIGRLTRDEVNRYDRRPKRISEKKCLHYSRYTRKRKNGVCYNSRSPHTVAVLKNNMLACSGVLISESFVLTAEYQCLREQNHTTLKVRIGQDLDKDIKKIYRHPLFDEGFFTSVNLGLLEIDTPVNLDRQLVPACVANEASENLYDNLLRTGYSGLQIFQYFESSENRLMSFKECDDFMRKSFFTALQEHQVCIQLLEDFEGTDLWTPAQGIPGSPLQTVNSRNCMATVVGIANRQFFGGENMIIYTRMASTVDWIEDIVWGNGSLTAAFERSIPTTTTEPGTTRKPVVLTFNFGPENRVTWNPLRDLDESEYEEENGNAEEYRTTVQSEKNRMIPLVRTTTAKSSKPSN
ncbi:uncharacterized protein LOC129752164 [Uranotaenia lowii]|uniref:uncharacterized protein LOC129752164 n=1 Tax=Uranotaenia lowii TaxID=190385 RepID=UPI00247987F7|nr:uncharacterized protein LOC129752164 [Uranotaenia lowii]